MPQEPKKKHSKARKRTRRAAINLNALSLISCSNCGQMRIPHQTCKKCGYYGKEQVITKTNASVTRAQ